MQRVIEKMKKFAKLDVEYIPLAVFGIGTFSMRGYRISFISR